MSLQGKRILLGVTGSIAAYKAGQLTRLMVKAGAEVQIIMSTSALDFITPLTLSTLSKKPVLHIFQDSKTGEWNNHVELGLWADLFLIAPITAQTLAKIANGFCDNLLTATYLSSRCPVMVAPAMDLDMYQHPAVKANLDKIRQNGNIVLDPESGELASGLQGEGRLMEPEQILKRLHDHFETRAGLSGKQFLITAGPTYEAIDPVRFIGNHSSGKMGISVAEAVADQGGQVILILGPSALETFHPLIKTIRVESASEMFEKARMYHSQADCCVFAAAVADYAPLHPSREKIKKQAEEMAIPLKKTIDIAETLGQVKKHHQVHIGFALETQEEAKNARAKLIQKNFDMIVLNSLNDEGAGFKHDTNKVSFFFQQGDGETTELLPKSEVAAMIVEKIKNIFSR